VDVDVDADIDHSFNDVDAQFTSVDDSTIIDHSAVVADSDVDLEAEQHPAV